MASSDSVPLSLSLFSSTSSEGGRTKMTLSLWSQSEDEPSDDLRALTPCTSMSRRQILPSPMTAWTAFFEVPYRFPENSAISTNSPLSFMASMASRLLK